MKPTELERFYELIDGLRAAMLTTRRADGHLQSRPMATQKPPPTVRTCGS
jgi:general stress protein 26